MARTLTIAGIPISDATDAFVIAEIGHNHQGSVEKCVELFQAAKLAGATAVKLQKRDNKSLYTEEFYNKPYDNENSFGPTYGAHREALEFGRKEYEYLKQVARDLGICFFATAFDIPSADFLADLDMPAYKLASGDIRNTPLIRHVARIGKPVIISTGAATLDDVRRAYDTARDFNDQVALLQCTAGYPAKFEELDLNVITTYRRVFPEAVIGLSAHDNGIAMAVAAYVLGGRIIEKHFTLNRAMKGTDHAFSLEPLGMQKMVRDLRRTRVALGSSEKRIFDSEFPALTKMGKKLVAARDLPIGHRLRPEDIAIKSPGGGLHPYEIDRLIGQRLTRPLKRDQAFEACDLMPLREVA
ncbi:MAG: N-acetylneuraminate synthase family protein [Gemmatales bacterium]|nr:N-acetylneuraminate synthase family protein [Gemmatales bacterium]MDW8385624.1 N-acetylneuraminate synthase family protein [Gemmatales bacterium]